MVWLRKIAQMSDVFQTLQVIPLLRKIVAAFSGAFKVVPHHGQSLRWPRVGAASGSPPRQGEEKGI